MDAAAGRMSLARFVEDIRAVETAAGRTFEVERLPDGRTTLIFRVVEHGHRADVAVSGPRTRAHYKHATDVVRVVVVQFQPGCSAPLLGVPADELTDRIVLLEDLWGRPGRELCDELVAAPSLQDVVDRVTHALVTRAREAPLPASGQLARHAVRLLEAGEPRVERVAQRLGVTARHLRRAFTASVGVGPKEYARAVRLQRAVQTAATSRDWARIAADAGYYDQAHLIADFRELVGLTPGAFLKRTAGVRPAVKDVVATRPGLLGAAAAPR